MAFLFLYHLVAGERQIQAIFSTVRDEACIIVLDRNKSAQGLSDVARIYANLLERRLNDSEGE